MTIPSIFHCRGLARASAALCLLSSTAGAQIIDTRTGEGIANVSTPALGQTFTAPAGATALLSFSFFVSTNGSDETTPPSTFQAYLIRWNGTRGEGPLLYASPVRAAAPSGGTLREETFDVGGLPIIPGAVYVAVLNQLDGTLVSRRAAQGGALVDSYSGGQAVIPLCPDDPSGDCFWLTYPTSDREFTATFASAAAVPEPGSLALVAAGLGGLVVGVRRRARLRRPSNAP